MVPFAPFYYLFSVKRKFYILLYYFGIVYKQGEVKIGKFKVLEKSIKRSFSNVRLDVLNIKEYLEKQHDIINSEIGELQSQLFNVKRDLKDNKKVIGEDYVKKDVLEKRLKIQIKNLRELRGELEDYDSRINKLNKNLSRLERESLSPSEFTKKTRNMSREISIMRSELDDEYEAIGEDLREIRKYLSKELIREQAKVLGKKIKKLDKSLEEVEELKEDLRLILQSAKKREKVKKEVVILEKKVTKKPFYKSVWQGVVDFFEEEPEVKKVEKKPKKKKEPEFGKRVWLSLVDFFTEKVDEKPKRKKKRDYKPIIIGGALVLIVLLALFFYFFGDDVLIALSGAFGANVTTVDIPPPEEQPEHIVVTVTENDFVNIVPDVSDPDDDELSYTFSHPLNKLGQWQTQIGDAGIYYITVTVSDGETETVLEFTLVVKPLAGDNSEI